MAKLQKVYEQNREKRKSYRYRIKNCIDKVIEEVDDKVDIQETLEREGIQIISRRNDISRIYGVTFPDLKVKVVFNGSE